MIDRYTRPEMGHIFSLENKYAIWQEIEVLACEAHAEMGKIGITTEEAAWIREHARFDRAEVDEIEAVITEKLSDLLDVQVGDTLQTELDSGEVLTLRVSGICKNYLRHFIYLNDASLPGLRHNTALLRLRADADPSRYAARLRGGKIVLPRIVQCHIKMRPVVETRPRHVAVV